jgi:hypothetical protein
MEGDGLMLMERPMHVDLVFTASAATVFWSDGMLHPLQQMTCKADALAFVDTIVRNNFQPDSNALQNLNSHCKFQLCCRCKTLFIKSQ